MFWEEKKKRKPFSTKTKKIEWMLASGKPAYNKDGSLNFVKTSRCRVCKTPLTWGNRRYDFDHKDNNPLNNTQKNCRLVCKSCHGEHTVIKKKRVTGFLGETIGYKTVKKKVGYKKPAKKKSKTKRVAIRDIFGDIVGYKTTKVRETTKTKKTTTKKPSKTTASKMKKTTRKKKTNNKKTKRKKRSDAGKKRN